MSDTSPMIRKEEETKLLFQALKFVAGFGGETEAAAAKIKVRAEVVAGKVLSQ